MDKRSPTKAFINVDFPTFGLPTIFTKPALCAILFIYATKILQINGENKKATLSDGFNTEF